VQACYCRRRGEQTPDYEKGVCTTRAEIFNPMRARRYSQCTDPKISVIEPEDTLCHCPKIQWTPPEDTV